MIALSAMIKADEDSLICDLAETYHVLNYRELPTKLLATLSCGLRADSRIKMKMNEQPCSTEIWLQSAIVDYLALIRQSLVKGAKRPKLLTQMLTQKEQDKIMSYKSASDFEKARERLLQKGDAKDGR